MSKENGKQSLAPPSAAGPSGRTSPSGGRISPAAGRMSPGGGGDLNGEAAKMPGANAAQRSPVNDKLIRILTVIAYLCSVSGAAFMLSLYYIFLWDPAGHGTAESKPAALHASHEHHEQHQQPTPALPSNSSLILRAIANATETIVDSVRTT